MNNEWVIGVYSSVALNRETIGYATGLPEPVTE